MKAYLLLEAGPRFEMKADMASCMTRDGAGFYASQGWTGGEGIIMVMEVRGYWLRWREH